MDNLEKERHRMNVPVTQISQNQRYELKMELLKKSEFFTKYIKTKMEDKAEARKIRKKKAEIRAKKLAVKNKGIPVVHIPLFLKKNIIRIFPIDVVFYRKETVERKLLRNPQNPLKYTKEREKERDWPMRKKTLKGKI